MPFLPRDSRNHDSPQQGRTNLHEEAPAMRNTKESPKPCLRERLLSETPASEAPASEAPATRKQKPLPPDYLRERLLSVLQTAELLGVSPSSVKRMIRRGELGPLITIGLRRQGLRAGPLLDAIRRGEAKEREARKGKGELAAEVAA
jgi:hypothetical protein